MKKTFKPMNSIFVSLLLVCSHVNADEITDTIQEALSGYKKGDFVQTKEDLTYALELLKQKQGESLKTLLPNALSGWKAEEATSETAGSGMLGGGTNAAREYKKDKATITISIVTDSPLMQSIGMMMSNPMFSSGGKLKRINREKSMVKYDEKNQSGEVSLVLEQRYLITVKGNSVTEEELIAYMEAIDFKKLKEL